MVFFKCAHRSPRARECCCKLRQRGNDKNGRNHQSRRLLSTLPGNKSAPNPRLIPKITFMFEKLSCQPVVNVRVCILYSSTAVPRQLNQLAEVNNAAQMSYICQARSPVWIKLSFRKFLLICQSNATLILWSWNGA